MMTVTMIATMMMGMMFMQMNHPLTMGMTLLIQTTLICMMTGTMSKSFWFAYILFLIFIGGMLVLFIYITALASNEMFSINTNNAIMMTMVVMAILIMMFMNDMFMTNINNENLDSMKLSMMKSFYWEASIDLVKLYNYPTNYITIMMMSYLLITLIAVVKITNYMQGPLRKMN